MSVAPEPGRSTPVIDLEHDRPDRRYDPGAVVGVRYRIGGIDPSSVRALEASVAWYTEGKGEEDLFVHAFERIVERERLLAALMGGTFTTTLPESPLSYEGMIVKIRWCVRLRVFFAGGRDFVTEHVFELGEVPPARLPEAAAP